MHIKQRNQYLKKISAYFDIINRIVVRLTLYSQFIYLPDTRPFTSSCGRVVVSNWGID